MNKLHLSIAVALIVLTTFVFAPVNQYGFVNYDDGLYVTKNDHVAAGLSWENTRWAFSFESSTTSGNWHPLTWLSLMLDVSLFGFNASAFHLVNVGLHVANVLLVFLLLFSMTGATRRSAFVAAVFAVHPLHVESVAWISERKDVLSTLFALLAILAWCRFIDVKPRWHRWRWQLISLVCFVLSLLSKQMYVTLPFVLLLLDYWPLGRWLSVPSTCDGIDNGRPSFRRVALEKLPFFMIACVFCLVAFFGQTQGGAVRSLDEFSLDQRCLNAGISYVTYLWKIVCPTGLAVFYPYPPHSQWFLAILAFAALLGITMCVVRQRIRHPYVIVGWFWFLGMLVPVIGLVQIGYQRMADRYMYLPITGPLFAATWLVASWADDKPGRKKVLLAASGLIVFVLALAARHQVTYWANTTTLFSHATEVAESGLAYTKIGYERSQNDDHRAAEMYYRRALRIDPGQIPAHYNLGHSLLTRGKIQEAILCFRAAVELDPDYAEAHQNLAVSYFQAGEISEAVEHWETLEKIVPDVAETHAMLGLSFVMLRRNDKAFEHLHRALEIKPRLTDARFTLGKLLVSVDRESEAVQHYEIGLKTRLDALDVHQELVRIYSKLGNQELADQHQRYVEAHK